MASFLFQFNSTLVAEGEREYIRGSVLVPLEWLEPKILMGRIRCERRLFNCKLVFNDDRTQLISLQCTCTPANKLLPSLSTPCKHIIAVIFAYEQSPSTVLTKKTIAVEQRTSNAPQPNAVPSSKHYFDKEQKLLRTANKKSVSQSKKVKQDNDVLHLDPQLKQSFENVAAALKERESLERSEAPELAYVICTTGRGLMPELKIYNTKDKKTVLVPPKSPIWTKSSLQQRQINALRKMVLPVAGRKLNYLESRLYGLLWMLLLKACLSTGRCFFESIDSHPLSYGPPAKKVLAGLRGSPKPDQLRQFLITNQHAELCEWSFPYYVDKKHNCAGEANVWDWQRWYAAFWSKVEAPQAAWSRLAKLLLGRLDLNCTQHFFPEIHDALIESQLLINRPAISNLIFSLEVEGNSDLPKVTPWTHQRTFDGKTKLVAIGWQEVMRNGSIGQQHIAAWYQMLLDHTTTKDIGEVGVSFDSWIEFIRQIVGTRLCYWRRGDDFIPLEMGPPLNVAKAWAKLDSSDHYKFVLFAGRIDKEGQVPAVLNWFIPMYVNQKSKQIGLVLGLPVGQPFKTLQSLPVVPVDKATAASNYIRALQIENSLGSLTSKVEWVDIAPKTSLTVSGKHPQRSTLLQFESPPETCYEQNGSTFIKTIDRACIANRTERIKALGFDLIEEPARPFHFKLVQKSDSCWQRLYKEIRKLRKEEFSISKTTEQELAPLDVSDSDFLFDTKSSGDGWFSMSLSIRVGEEDVNLLPILLSAISSLPEINEAAIDSLNDNGKFLAALNSGSLVSIPFERIKFILMSLNELLSKLEPSDTAIDLPAPHAISLLEHEGFSVSRKILSQDIQKFIEQSQQLLERNHLEPSTNFNAELRDYQKVGLNWLDQLCQLKAGGILADEMGLGKTVQVIAKLALDKTRDSGFRPVLVICPKSVIGNWLNELACFAPELQVMQYTGAGREKLQAYFKLSDVVITTYGTLLRDQKVLTNFWWHGVILDEAHTIKTSGNAITNAAKELVADYRICMTGTPVENHLGELWSLFDFLMPKMLGSKSRFRKFIQKPAEEGNLMAPMMLRKLVSPFILRRLKGEVLNDLPAKNESIIRVDLSEKQLDLYEAVRLLSTEELKEEIANKQFSPRSPKTVEILTRLRQVCLHPSLCKIEHAKNVKDSAKFEALFERLELLLEAQRKVLVFSQFVEMLEFIGNELKTRAIPFLKLIGDVELEDRTRMVQEFQETDVQVFLISLLAGGHGLNLTKADTVIIYDPWWNPAKEAQAIDRAHRIGQENPVFVFRMIAAGTLEEKMLELKSRKLAISNLIYESDDDLISGLTEDDIHTLLEPVLPSGL